MDENTAFRIVVGSPNPRGLTVEIRLSFQISVMD